MGGLVSFGYRRENKRLIVDRQEASIIERIYEIYIETGSLSAVYNAMKAAQAQNRKGKPLTKQALSHILRNAVYAGKIKHRDKFYDGVHEAIIPLQVFELAQTFHGQREKKFRIYKEHILGGIIRCTECDYQMSPSFANKHRKGKLKRYFYYRCQTTLKKDWDSCNAKQVSADKVETLIADKLRRILQDDSYLENLIFRWNHDPKHRRSAHVENSTSADHQPHGKGFELSDSVIEYSVEGVKSVLQKALALLDSRKEGGSGVRKLEKSLELKSVLRRVEYSSKTIELHFNYGKRSSGAFGPVITGISGAPMSAGGVGVESGNRQGSGANVGLSDESASSKPGPGGGGMAADFGGTGSILSNCGLSGTDLELCC